MSKVSFDELRELYALLGKGSLEINHMDFNKRYGEVMRDNSGIPVPFGGEALRLSEKLADRYETFYDQAKAIYKERDVNPFPLVLGDNGSPIAVNFCAIMSTAYIAQLLDEEEMIPYGVLAVHGLLSSENHKWVFSHLCEARYALFNVAGVRSNISEKQLDLVDDLGDMLEEAIVQYGHTATHLAL